MRTELLNRDVRGRNFSGFALLVGLLAALPAFAQDLARPRDHVADHANVIRDDVERQIIKILAELEQKTGSQILVVTIPTTSGRSIEDYTLKLAEKWKLGQKGNDNGALIVVAVRDRNYRIEVGYGLESILTDGVVGGIGRKYFVPYFKRSDYSSGIYAGTLAIVQKVAQENGVTISGAPAGMAAPGGSGGGGANSYRQLWFIPFVIVVIVLKLLGARARYYGRWGGGGSSSWLFWMLLGNVMGSGRRHYGGGSGWGGGFGGGGFGGGSFGGGGGGGFGGGGASGSW